MTGLLAGARVVGLAGLGPGPFAAILLADVTPVARIGGPAAGAPHYVMHPRTPLGGGGPQAGRRPRRTARAVEGSDALIEGDRAGVMERLGLGPDEMPRPEAAVGLWPRDRHGARRTARGLRWSRHAENIERLRSAGAVAKGTP